MKRSSVSGSPYNTKTLTTLADTGGTRANLQFVNLNEVLYLSYINSSAYGKVNTLDTNWAAWTTTSFGNSLLRIPFLLTDGTLLYGAGDASSAVTHLVWKYTPGGAWAGMGNPGTVTTSNGFCLHEGKFYHSYQVTVYEYQSGTTWASIGTPGHTGKNLSLCSHAGLLYAWSVDDLALGNILVSVWAGGTTWIAAGTATPINASDALSSASDGISLYIGTNTTAGEVFKCTPPSTTWDSLGLVGGTIAKNSLQCVDGKIWAMTSAGTFEKYISGTSWETVYTGTNIARCMGYYKNCMLFGGGDSITNDTGYTVALGLHHP